MENLEIPYIGSRNIKTALSVFICLIFWPNSFYAAIAAVICVQSTVENSFKVGISRLIGTFLGGTLSLIFLYTINYFNLRNFIPIIVPIGVSLVIYICTLIKKPTACSISSIIFIIILVSDSFNDPLMYSVHRMLETSFGVVVAILVNKYVLPPKGKKKIKYKKISKK